MRLLLSSKRVLKTEIKHFEAEYFKCETVILHICCFKGSTPVRELSVPPEPNAHKSALQRVDAILLTTTVCAMEAVATVVWRKVTFQT